MANILSSVSPQVQRCVYIHRPSKLPGCCGCPEYGTIFHVPRDAVQRQHFQCRFPCADATEKSQCSVRYIYQGCKLMIRDRLSFEMISHPFAEADKYEFDCHEREASSCVDTLCRVHDLYSLSRSC